MPRALLGATLLAAAVVVGLSAAPGTRTTVVHAANPTSNPSPVGNPGPQHSPKPTPVPPGEQPPATAPPVATPPPTDPPLQSTAPVPTGPAVGTLSTPQGLLSVPTANIGPTPQPTGGDVTLLIVLVIMVLALTAIGAFVLAIALQ